MKQPEYIDTTLEEASTAEVNSKGAGSPVALLPPARSDNQLQRFGKQVSVFLGQLPDYVGKFFNDNKRPLIVVALFVAALITLRALFSAVHALNNIPLVGATFQFIGFVYSIWFIYRYLLKASNRQELYRNIQAIAEQVVGRQISPTTEARQPDEDNSIIQVMDNRTSTLEQPASTGARESATQSVPEVIRSHPEQASWVEAPREQAQEEKVSAPQQPASTAARESSSILPDELELQAAVPVGPPLTEEKAVAQAVEATLAAATEPEESSEDQATHELMRPNPPDAELVEAAVHDAEEKSLDFSPPETVDSEGATHSKR